MGDRNHPQRFGSHKDPLVFTDSAMEKIHRIFFYRCEKISDSWAWLQESSWMGWCVLSIVESWDRRNTAKNWFGFRIHKTTGALRWSLEDDLQLQPLHWSHGPATFTSLGVSRDDLGSLFRSCFQTNRGVLCRRMSIFCRSSLVFFGAWNLSLLTYNCISSLGKHVIGS